MSPSYAQAGLLAWVIDVSNHSAENWIGRTVDGRYEVVERVGDGGMGAVYKARQTSVERFVAIKVLHKHVAGDPEWVRRFYNEARACSQLNHPNTIRLFDFGQTTEGNPYMVMEFLDGKSLRQVIHHEAPLTAERTLKILTQGCASLIEAHRAGIIHRDIKPDNVFLIDLPDAQDHVKVLDFSVAKLLQEAGKGTAAGLVFGTPQYMSPEQASGEALDARADLYSLGILGYEMLSKKLPFDDDNPMVVLGMLKTDRVPPLPPVVPVRLTQLILRCLEKDPNKRPATAAELLAGLEDVRLSLRRASGGVSGLARQRSLSAAQRTLQNASAVGVGADGHTPVPIGSHRTLQDASGISAAATARPGPAGGTLQGTGTSPLHGNDRTLLEDQPPEAVQQIIRQQEAGNYAPARTLRDSAAPPPRGPGQPVVSVTPRQTAVMPDDQPGTSVPTAPYRPGPSPLFWVLCALAAAAVAVGSYYAVIAING